MILSYNNLKTQLADLWKEIQQLSYAKDYTECLKKILEANDICKQLYQEATDMKTKQEMLERQKNLQILYTKCSKIIKEQTGKDPIIKKTSTNSKAPEKATTNSEVKKETEEKEETGEKKLLNKDGKEVTYKFNGVDVEPYLDKDSNSVVMFTDVKGMVAEKRLIEREFFVDEKVKQYRKFMKVKDKNFILLYGVPGTGKTFFAKAISCELKARTAGDEEVPFFSIGCGTIKDSKVGGTEKNIKAIFDFCKQFNHCVLFLDEFDALVPDRQKDTGDPTAVSTVTSFLQVLDGFSSGNGTLLIAATNCPYNIDGAVLSRAAAQIEIPLPTVEVIKDVLQAKIGSQIAADVNLAELATKLEGYSNRDIKNLTEYLKDLATDAFNVEMERIKLEDPARYDALTGDALMAMFQQYKITNEMVAKGLEEKSATTRIDDLRAIENYKKGL